MMKIITTVFRLILITAIATGSALLFGCTRPSSADNQASIKPAPAADSSNRTPPAQNPEEKIPRISAEDAKKLVSENKAVIIDVRGTDLYKLNHIKGSLDFPLNKLETGEFTGLPKDKKIIAYCTCGHEQTSSRAAVILTKAGFTDTAALLGGLHAWETAGGAVEKQ